LAFLAVFSNARPLQLVGYQYLPDLNGDSLLSLKEKIESDFETDTGLQLNLTFDFTFALDPYTPSSIVYALTSGGFDLFEIDTVALGYVLNASVISKTPIGADFTGFFPQTNKMCEGFPQPSSSTWNFWAYPSYSCVNVFYTYDSSLSTAQNVEEVVEWIHHNRAPHSSVQVGYASDLWNPLDLRLAYIDSWLDSNSPQHLYPGAYYGIDSPTVGNIKRLRNTCTDRTQDTNYCTDGTYYNDPTLWFTQFATGGSLLLQGFPEYLSSILAADPLNTDVNNPAHVPFSYTALTGDGNTPYIFTDAFVISKENCKNVADEDGWNCISAATAFFNWSKLNYARIASLGLDLSPVRPRFLTLAYEPFYSSAAVAALPAFARTHYAFEYEEVARSTPLETLHFWANEVNQGTELNNRVIANFDP